ncbi:membrane protein insertase YidC [Macrococcus sp. DPC7161]|uniref:membrane protein insertase YidC n=1 Tax=Macrococcus sp. DPC7161 TaxID=2507060 RepID=UPI00100AD4CC|nr:membrane protein insertase YidC [Macrococcus sp. DPC7161]RXK17543.1 membrane protein insertase YidC [Macrococcus sp. DPC7161]
MKNKALLPLLLGITVFLAGCDYSKQENRKGFFYDTFVHPLDQLIHWLGSNMGHNYGLAIIAITLIVRLALFPFMMRTYKNQSIMKEKMALIKPQLTEIQERTKRARTQEEKMQAQQDMMALYKDNGINPLNMGCLPLLIQLPIVTGLFYVLKYPTEGGITKYPHFLWFDLTKTDIALTVIAGIVYAVQAYVSMQNIPDEQKQQMKMMMFISPIMIVWMSAIAPAALPLYWAVGGAFLVFQTWLGNKFYSKKVHEELAPMIEAHEREEAAQRKNTKVAPKKKKRK